MIPDSIGAVVAFLLLIAPGYVWDRQACRFTPEQRTTALREAAHIVFSSLIPSTLAGLALLPVWLLLPTTAVSPLLLLAVGLLTCAVACAISFGWSCLHFWPERALVGQISRGSALFKALVGSPRRSDITQVVITAVMDDGTLWRGVHGAHDVDPEETPRMLFLTPPVLRREAGRKKIVKLKSNEYVVLPLERVRSLQLTYLMDPKAAAPDTSPVAPLTAGQKLLRPLLASARYLRRLSGAPPERVTPPPPPAPLEGQGPAAARQRPGSVPTPAAPMTGEDDR